MTSNSRLNLQTQGRLATPEQFGNIVLRANPDGSLLRVRDVARVELGAQNLDTESRLNGAPAVAIGIYLSPGANAVETASLVTAALDRLSQRFPPGLKYLVNYDTTTFVRATIHDVLITLVIAFALVVVVVFVFLGSLRATLIPAIAVPVSLIGSFAVLLMWAIRPIRSRSSRWCWPSGFSSMTRSSSSRTSNELWRRSRTYHRRTRRRRR